MYNFDSIPGLSSCNGTKAVGTGECPIPDGRFKGEGEFCGIVPAARWKKKPFPSTPSRLIAGRKCGRPAR
jgi:hypothetical protein